MSERFKGIFYTIIGLGMILINLVNTIVSGYQLDTRDSFLLFLVFLIGGVFTGVGLSIANNIGKSKEEDWTREQEIALVCMYIRENEVLNGTIAYTFDNIYKISCEFVNVYGVNETKWGVELEYEETIVSFANAYVKRNMRVG